MWHGMKSSCWKPLVWFDLLPLYVSLDVRVSSSISVVRCADVWFFCYTFRYLPWNNELQHTNPQAGCMNSVLLPSQLGSLERCPCISPFENVGTNRRHLFLWHAMRKSAFASILWQTAFRMETTVSLFLQGWFYRHVRAFAGVTIIGENCFFFFFCSHEQTHLKLILSHLFL